LSCLDDVALERVLLELALDEQRLHAEQCAQCRARLATLRAQGEDFHRFVFPRTVDAVVASRRPRRLAWLGLLAAPLAAGLALAFWPAGPGDDYVGVKGSTVGLAVFTLDPSGAPVRLSDGARIPATASLRFRVAPSRPCHLWIFTLDDRGQVSRLFPVEGEAPLVSAETTVPGGATLDGVPGAERVFALCTPRPVAFAEVAAQATLAGATTLRERNTVPVEGLQGSLLLEKAR